MRKLFGCLIKFFLFLVLLPLMAAMPPLVYFFFMWMVFTAYFLRHDK